MNQRKPIQPLSLNMDVSPKKLGPTDAWYLLNHERALNPDGTKRGTLGKTTPMVANYMACDIEQPAGENYGTGRYYSKLTNEEYSWKYNNNGIHSIQRINGNGICEVVYVGCLNLSAEPKHSIESFRAHLVLDKLCANRHGKTLVFTDGLNDIGSLDVEASIATGYFTTPFFSLCANPCDFVKMCVPDPCGCLTGAFETLAEADRGLSNNITDIGFKFSYRHVYYDGRTSIYADPSTLFYQDTKCFDSPEGLPRCIKLRVPVGNPMVEKIEIVYWTNGIWKKYDVVDKYKKYNSTQEFWYDRELSEQVEDTFSEEDCSFDYVFCNNKQCEVISPEEFNRVFNPMPREAQGFFPIGLKNQEDTALAFYNYKQGNCPIDQNEAAKFDVNIVCDDDSCQPKITTLTFYAVVHNRSKNVNQPIFRLGGDAANSPDDDSDIAYFGGLNDVGSGDLELGHLQNFRDDTRNFIAYIEGTEYWATAKQWKADPFFTNKEEWGTLGHFDDNFEKRRWRRAIANGQYFYQKFEIKVPQGTKGFLRLSSHNSTGNDQDKSTFVVGIFNSIVNYSGSIAIHSGNTDLVNEEIYFDTCNQTELEILSPFVIEDNAIDDNISIGPDDPLNPSNSFSGYVKDKNGLPVEGAIVQIKDGSDIIASSVTDFNGFYHLYAYPGRSGSYALIVLVEQACAAPFSQIFEGSVQSERGTSATQDVTIQSDAYAADFYANLSMRVVDCTGNGIPGIRVALSGSKYQITGTDGTARFKPRNYSSRARTFRAVVINKSGCITTDCNHACDPCMPMVNGNATACYQGIPPITMANATINIESALAARNGLKSGGNYGFGFVVKGSCGRQSAVYPIKYIDVPRTQEKEKQNFCSFTFNANNITLPLWSECLSIVRTENQKQFELQWVVDEISRTDDGKIKLTIQSLNDYNERFFFKTNTVYSWLKGDRVEFIKNGDGTIFSIAQYGLLNYLTLSPFNDENISGETEPPADFFNQLLITDDGKLNDLKKGAIIELTRAKECTIEPAYYSICATIPVVNGSPVIQSGTFRTFDTYYVTRKIGEFPSMQFEHHNPSDFWGDQITRLTDAGRGYFVNKYENEKRFGRNITINSPNQMNRFGDIVKKLNPSTHGDIIAISVKDNKIGLCISEHDWSLFEVGDDLLRVGEDGLVRTTTSDQIMSDSQSKLSGAYGCQYPHIGSILFGDGWATWVDVNKHCHIKHDYNIAKAMDQDKAQRYFRRRCQEIETFNRAATDPLNKFRFVSGFNYSSGAGILTIKSLRHSGINNTSGPFKLPNETILFEPLSEDYLGFGSFTAEAYGQLDLFDDNGCSFIAYLNGVPYIHPIIYDKWNEFFGVPCDWRVGVSLNFAPEKVIIPLSLELESDKLFFVEEVTTEKANFRSEIPPRRFRGVEGHWDAVFLGNSNSRSGLFGDEVARGYYAEVLFVRDNTIDHRVGTIDNAKRTAYSELDQIIFKLMISEASGVTQNL